jgi:HSP20 family protein
MSGLVPFNSRKFDLMNPGFGALPHMLDDFFADTWPLRRDIAADTFKIDVRDSGEEYTLEAELPGVTKDEIDLSLQEGRLRISVNKDDNMEAKTKNYLHRERRYSAMSRRVYLADAAPEGIKAKLEHGVLTISATKKAPSANNRHIEIE